MNIKNVTKQLPSALGLGAGAILSGYVKKFVPIGNETVKSIIPVAVGLFLSGNKGITGDLGKGMIAGGLKDLAASKGIGAIDTVMIQGLEELDFETEVNGVDFSGSGEINY